MNKNVEDEDYKDKISTVYSSGKRKWIYALQPKGELYTYRTYLSYFYLVLLCAIPFIKIHGDPLFLFNLPKGIFIIFGKIFYPQDFVLLGLAMIIFILFIVIFTLAYGRIFCGWMCPQTVFLEIFFRRIEYWLEGSATRQRANDAKAWTTEIYIRKMAKHLIFFAFSFFIANIFLTYIIGVSELKTIMLEPVSKHLIGFIAILIFSFVFYFVFAHAREIVCTVVCPYGRLQSVLLDKNSIVVAYDYLRGEPRAKASKGREPGAGDCIDCDLCVQVCPTGIDIRNGTQMECTNCTACIDACNMMMKKTSRPPDLIKYASENNIKEGASNRFTYRIKMYTAALVVLVGLFTYLLGTRKTLDVTVMRVSGQILQENKDGTISNLYRMKIINKSGLSQPFKLIPSDPELKLHFVGKQEDSIPGKSQNEYMFFINKSTEDIKTRKELFKLKIMSGPKVMHNVKLPFIGEN